MAIRNQKQPRAELDQFVRLKKLWAAVVRRAIDDLFDKSQSVKSDAHWYIYDDSSGFREICDILELNCDLIRSSLINLDRKNWYKNKRFSYARVETGKRCKPIRRK